MYRYHKPIIKNTRESISNSENFRGICLQSSLCKIMDLVILKKEQASLQTSELQFGFKKGLSANVAASIVKETVDYYLNRGGRVYCLALDASKAFDRVSFSKLFKGHHNKKILFVCLNEWGINIRKIYVLWPYIA